MAIISYYIRNRGYAAYNAYHTMVYEFLCNDGVTLYYNISKITILDIAKAIRQTRIYMSDDLCSSTGQVLLKPGLFIMSAIEPMMV